METVEGDYFIPKFSLLKENKVKTVLAKAVDENPELSEVFEEGSLSSLLFSSEAIKETLLSCCEIILEKEREWILERMSYARMVEIVGLLCLEEVQDRPDPPEGETSWTFARLIESMSKSYGFTPDQVLGMSKFELSEMIKAANARIEEQEREAESGSGRRRRRRSKKKGVQSLKAFAASQGLKIKEG